MLNPHRYRIELQQPRRTRVLATGLEVTPHFRSLDPYLSRLLQEGKTGMLVLIDLNTGARVARRQVRAPKR